MTHPTPDETVEPTLRIDWAGASVNKAFRDNPQLMAWLDGLAGGETSGNS